MIKRKIILFLLLLGFFGLLPSSHMDIHLFSTPDPLWDHMEHDPCFRYNTFYIYTQKEYLRFAGYVNRDYENGSFTLKNAKLLADIDLTAKEGYDNLAEHPYIRPNIEYFKGIFNGNGHTIIWDSLLDSPMFTSIEHEGKVKNLHFKGDYRRFSSPNEIQSFGMICMKNKGEIVNCVTYGSIEVSLCHAGGIAGINYGLITHCTNYANITVLGDDTHAGGITGENRHGSISNCNNQGTVCIQGSGRCCAGGIAGSNESLSIDYCTNQGEISILGSGLCSSGGIAGSNQSIISFCTNDGSIKNHWQSGGISGYNHGAVEDCKNTGSVSVLYGEYQKDRNPKVRGTENGAGGICGYMKWGYIKNCCNCGEISVPDEDGQIAFGVSRTKPETSTIENSVCLKGTVLNFWRSEEIMMLNETEMELWSADHEQIPYQINSWQFDLEAVKKKLPIIPLGVEESLLTTDYDEVFLCDEFCLRCPVGFYIADTSPYALCLKARPKNDTDNCFYEIWLLRLNPEAMTEDTVMSAIGLKGRGFGSAQVIWNYNDGISTSQWLFLITHPNGDFEPNVFRELLDNFYPLPYQILVFDGETLSFIAQKYTRDKERYPELAARNELSDENRIYVDQELTLPDEWLIYYHPPDIYSYFY